MMESNLRRSLVMGQGSMELFLSRPIALDILAAAAITFVTVLRRMRRPARYQRRDS